MTRKTREDQARQTRRSWQAPAVSKLVAGLAEAAPFSPGAADTGTIS
jgi:hypothetical protein